MSKKVEFIFFFVLIIGFLSYLYMSRPSTDYFLSKSEKHFNSTSNFEKVHLKYVGKVIDIKGVVDTFDDDEKFTNINLDGSFLFSIESVTLTKEIAINDELIIKGRYEGYDDLFDEYSFTDCSVKE